MLLGLHFMASFAPRTARLFFRLTEPPHEIFDIGTGCPVKILRISFISQCYSSWPKAISKIAMFCQGHKQTTERHWREADQQFKGR
jgi:hypothetical protein